MRPALRPGSVALALLMISCGGAQSGDATSDREVETCPEDFGPPIPDAPAASEWWTNPENACPDEALVKGTPPPLGEEVWCELPDGTRYGRWTWWYSEDKKISDGSYNRNGEPEGPWVGWHENGNRKMQGSYTDGKKHGQWVMFHENGTPSTAITFENGEEHGKWVWWYESGNKAGEGEFLHSKPHGRWTRCSDEGNVTKIEIYDNDVLVKSVEYVDGRRVESSK